MRKIDIKVAPKYEEFYKENPWLFEGLIEDLKDKYEDDLEHKPIHYEDEDITIDIYEVTRPYQVKITNEYGECFYSTEIYECFNETQVLLNWFKNEKPMIYCGDKIEVVEKDS